MHAGVCYYVWQQFSAVLCSAQVIFSVTSLYQCLYADQPFVHMLVLLVWNILFLSACVAKRWLMIVMISWLVSCQEANPF